MTAPSSSTPMPIRYLIFDLGGTLMHARDDWQPIHQQADDALVQTLSKHGIELKAEIFRARLHEYYQQRDKDFHETTYHLVLRELLQELHHAEVDESILRSALDALFSVTQTNWQLEADAIEMLEQLKSTKFRLGIFSNAGDNKDVQQLIESFEIGSYFDFVLTSAACFYRKPHPRAFEIALAHWNADPKEAAMIGDSLSADIAGAKNLNMISIWISRRAQFDDDEMRRIQPDFSLRKLTELLPTLDRLSISRI